jgi:dTDP-4-amino-4,6-dideoxygalactose transaminase
MSVPFIDMYRIHFELEEVFKERFDEVLKNSAFIKGKYLKQFEQDFARWVGTKHCLGVGSGHDGLILSLKALNVGPGDKVVAPAMTFISTVEAIHEVGASIELVDVDSDGLIDLERVEDLLKTGEYKCMIAVHLYGKMVNPHALKRLKDKYGVFLLEDCAQAHGANIDGINAGTVGDVSEFSFYPGKNLGALGDGGAVCTSNDLIAKKIESLREHGQTRKYHHEFLGGTTSRLDNLQAAFLIEKLKCMDEWNIQRQQISLMYNAHLKGEEISPVHNLNHNEHVFHLVVLNVAEPEKLGEFLSSKGIGHGRHYPIPIHHMECFKEFSFYYSKFPNAERFAYKTISVPVFPGMTETEVENVCKAIKEYSKTTSVESAHKLSQSA